MLILTRFFGVLFGGFHVFFIWGFRGLLRRLVVYVCKVVSTGFFRLLYVYSMGCSLVSSIEFASYLGGPTLVFLVILRHVGPRP